MILPLGSAPRLRKRSLTMSFGEKCLLQIVEFRDGVQPGLFITFSQDLVNISGSLKRCFASLLHAETQHFLGIFNLKIINHTYIYINMFDGRKTQFTRNAKHVSFIAKPYD